MSRDAYLELTYRRGRLLAGYLHLPRQDGDRAHHSKKVAPGLVADFAADGRPIGLEIVSPSQASAETINAALSDLRLATLTKEDLAPLVG